MIDPAAAHIQLVLTVVTGGVTREDVWHNLQPPSQYGERWTPFLRLDISPPSSGALREGSLGSSDWPAASKRSTAVLMIKQVLAEIRRNMLEQTTTVVMSVTGSIFTAYRNNTSIYWKTDLTVDACVLEQQTRHSCK